LINKTIPLPRNDLEEGGKKNRSVGDRAFSFRTRRAIDKQDQSKLSNGCLVENHTINQLGGTTARDLIPLRVIIHQMKDLAYCTGLICMITPVWTRPRLKLEEVIRSSQGGHSKAGRRS